MIHSITQCTAPVPHRTCDQPRPVLRQAGHADDCQAGRPARPQQQRQVGPAVREALQRRAGNKQEGQSS